MDEHLNLNRLRRFWMPPASAAATLRAPLVHVVREPLEACVSAYQYHLHASEDWLRVPRKEEEVLRSHPLAATLAGLPWQEVLRRTSARDGIELECRRSIKDQIAQQAEAFNATRADARVFTMRMEATEKDFDGTMRKLFTFLGAAHASWPGIAAERPQVIAPVSGSAAKSAGDKGDGKADDGVAALVAEASKFDIARHRTQMDDGHLSSIKLKRQLRGLLLNGTRLVAELGSWRAATGYDRKYSTHCARYGVAYYEQAVADGFADGASLRRRKRKRRSRRSR